MTEVVAAGRAEGLDGLLREVRRQAARGAEPDLSRVLDWLHRQSGAHVGLVEGESGAVGPGTVRPAAEVDVARRTVVRHARESHPTALPTAGGTPGTVMAATDGFPRTVLGPLAPLLARMHGGELAAAATQVGDLSVRCEALGPREPCPVLVAVGGHEPVGEAATLLPYVASVLGLLWRAGESDRTWDGFQQKARQVRFAVLTALLAGEPMLARRMTVGVVPPLLDASRLRVHLLRCPPGERERIVRALQDSAGYHGPDLMVQCPVFADHLICLITDVDNEHADSGDSGGNSRTDNPGTSGGDSASRAEDLRRLVRDDPRCSMGISAAHPLGAAAEAYSQAAHALAAAHVAPGRIASHHGRTMLDGVLVRRQAVGWARALLRPLEAAPKPTADITRLSVGMPRSAVAKLLGLSRNTVSAHLARAEHALGQDLADVRSRAAVHLAFAIGSWRTDDEPDEPDEPQDPVALDDLLRTEQATVWARALLGPLGDRHRRTLQVWIHANTDARQAARQLGISRNTVRSHIRAVETRLGLDLLTTGIGVHDVVHALRITDGRSA
ncbi:helix-turn-helix domain-containing protein [Streptomyces sp. bgisy031]|uniref:helix-turn-helix domain-containing protein n=1 Tax=Streptomyces sp. bgisy031 TaxID=3413772 RepID=UPI003D72C0A5